MRSPRLAVIFFALFNMLICPGLASAQIFAGQSGAGWDLDGDGDVDRRDLRLYRRAARQLDRQRQATEVAFAGGAADSFIEGEADALAFTVNGALIEGMQYVRVEAWSQQTGEPVADFSHVVTGEPDADGYYWIEAWRLASLPADGYLLQLSLHELRWWREATLSMTDHWVTVQPQPQTLEPQSQSLDAQSDAMDTLADEDYFFGELTGDFNLDGQVTNTDIQAMLDAMVDLEGYKNTYYLSDEDVLAIGDVNGDGAVTNADIQALVDLLAGGGGGTGGGTGSKQVVWNLQVQSGATYRDLVIKGGVRAVWQSINNVTFINCDFREAEMHVVVQARDDGSDASSNWTFDRCTFVGATRSDWGHSHGAFLQGAENFVFRDCVFKDNGWLDGLRFNQNHHVYLIEVGDVRFTRCTFERASAQGIKALGFNTLTVEDCTFRGNLIDIGGDDRGWGGELVVQRCDFLNTGGYDSTGAALGWGIHIDYNQNGLNSVLIEDCTWVGPGVPNNTLAVKLKGNVGEAWIIRADLSQWNTSGSDQWGIINNIGSALTIID